MMEQKYLDVFEGREWRVHEDESGVELEWFTPAGEDFLIWLPDCTDDNLVEQIISYYNGFDPEEHALGCVEMRGAPGIRALLEDADDIKIELKSLIFNLKKARGEE